ncbi:MAG: hypothetical protein QM484_11425 [Woeseiaceae bacterium]
MIFKSSQREHEKELASHLLKNDENETVSVIQIHDLASETVHDALMEMKALSRSTYCKQHIYHVSASPEPGQRIRKNDWNKIWKIYEHAHNITGQPFVEVEHLKNRRIHRHRAYSRINILTGKAINLGHSKIKNERASRQIEIELGHNIIKGKHDYAVINRFKKEKLFTHANLIENNKNRPLPIGEFTEKELQKSKRLNINTDEVRKAIYTAWDKSSCSGSFQKKLAESGYLIAQGNKALVVITSDGDAYPILRSIKVIKKKKREKTLNKPELLTRISNNVFDIPYIVDNFKNIIKDKLSWQTANISVLLEIHNNFKKPQKQILTKNYTPTTPKRTLGIKNKLQSAKNNITPAAKWVFLKKNILNKHYNTKLNTEDIVEITKHWYVEKLSNKVLILRNNSGRIYDHGTQIISNCSNHEKAAKVMIELAIAKGWGNVNINGSDEFKMEVYKQCIKKNVTCNIDANDIVLWQKVMKQHTKHPRLS